MIINSKTHMRNSERRRRRIITPIIYFLAEGVLVWLVLALIQLNFNMATWSIWTIFVFIMGAIYSIAKTVKVYQRQKEYPTEEEYKQSK